MEYPDVRPTSSLPRQPHSQCQAPNETQNTSAVLDTHKALSLSTNSTCDCSIISSNHLDSSHSSDYHPLSILTPTYSISRHPYKSSMMPNQKRTPEQALTPSEARSAMGADRGKLFPILHPPYTPRTLTPHRPPLPHSLPTPSRPPSLDKPIPRLLP